MSSFSTMLTFIIIYAPPWMSFWMVYTGGLDDFIYSSDVYSEFMVIKLLRVSFKNPCVRTVKITLSLLFNFYVGLTANFCSVLI